MSGFDYSYIVFIAAFIFIIMCFLIANNKARKEQAEKEKSEETKLTQELITKQI